MKWQGADFPAFGLNFLNVRLLKTRDLPSKKPIEFLMIGVIKFLLSKAPGRYLEFLRCSLISLTVSTFRAQMVVWAFRAVKEATVVPQEPPPNKPTFKDIFSLFVLGQYTAHGPN